MRSRRAQISMQLSRRTLRSALRALYFWLRRIVIHGVPGFRLQYERHYDRVRYYQARRIVAVQLRPANRRSLGFRCPGTDRRSSFLFVRRCQERDHLCHHQDGEIIVGWRVAQSYRY